MKPESIPVDRPSEPPTAPRAHPTEKIHLAPLPLHRRKGSWATVLVVLVGIALCGAGVVHLTRPAPKPVNPTRTASVITVETRPVSTRTLPQTLVVTGTISAWDQLTIGSEVSGLRIESVPVDEGYVVRKGQVLAVLDSSVLRAQLAQHQARLQGSRAAARKALQPNRAQDIASFRAGVHQAQANVHQEEANLRQARANLQNAQLNATRYQGLLGQGYATRQEVENRLTELDRSRALEAAARERLAASRFSLDQARQRYSLALEGGRQEDVQIAQAGTSEIEATIQQLRAQIAQTVISAPDDGLIIRRDAHIGDITSPGKSLFTMVRQHRLELRAQVPQVDLPLARLGARVRVTGGGREVQGRLREMMPVVDPASRLATARIDVPTSSGLMPGMFVRGLIEAGSRSALVVPSTAVLGTAENHYVLVYDNGIARRRQVSVGRRERNDVEITDGLKAGESVILAGGAFLADGDPVSAASPSAAAPAGSAPNATATTVPVSGGVPAGRPVQGPGRDGKAGATAQ